jgi:hypothetical protein
MLEVGSDLESRRAVNTIAAKNLATHENAPVIDSSKSLTRTAALVGFVFPGATLS